MKKIKVKVNPYIQYKCPKCGYVYMGTKENHEFHKTDNHEVRILEGYSFELKPKYDVVAKTKL